MRYILFPVVPIYYLVTWLRNKFYDLGIKKSVSYDFPVICVGNLSVGGTGKTPMIEYLVNLLKDNHNLATLSRGYKRKTNGFQLANETSMVETLGDEPFQFYNKFKDNLLVAVDADRRNGIEKLKSVENAPNIILLDDAYQHRKVKAGFNILLTTYDKPYFKDFVLPTGDLREPRSGAKRADVIVVTKCPVSLSKFDKTTIVNHINPESHQHVFFSSIGYSEMVLSDNKTLLSGDKTLKLEKLNYFTLVTGIANATPLVQFLKDKNLNFEHLNFKDHHNFTSKDVEELNKKEMILTTEKDYMRLKQYGSLKSKLFYLPIEVVIDENQKLDKLIQNFVTRS